MKEGQIRKMLDMVSQVDETESYAVELGSEPESTKLPPNFRWMKYEYTDDELDPASLNQITEFVQKNWGSGMTENFLHVKNYLSWLISHRDEEMRAPIVLGLEAFIAAKNEHKLVGLVIGSPFQADIRDTVISSIEARLLCVLTKYRGKRMSCLLIKELTRLATLDKFEYGMFYSENCVAKPMCIMQVWQTDLPLIRDTFR